ncbi:hypothetical protein GCM10027341_39160 [Spirosoma knui]
MERVISSLLASLFAAPLFYFATAWLLKAANSETGGPDDRLAVAYLSTFGGFAAMIIGFFLVGFVTYRFLSPHYLRIVQLTDAVALIGWIIVYMNYADQQPQRLDYGDYRPVLEVELRATNALLGDSAIDSLLTLDFSGGTDVNSPHPEQIRHEADVTILPWETTPIDVKQWEVRAFLRNQPMLFPLDLPRRPDQSTDWSNWQKPVQYQDYTLPEKAKHGLSLRYRFRLIPYGQP